MSLLERFVAYGPEVAYAILFLGSLVEGESFVLTAGYLAYKKYLSFPVIVLIAFLGSLIADQILFFVGRKYGPGLFLRWPHLKPAGDRAFKMLHRYKTSFIFFFRFVYGIRTVSPLMIGASGISIMRFSLINLIAALIWSVLSCGAGYAIGYYFSGEIEAGLALAQKWFTYIIGLGLLVGFSGLFVWHWRTHKD
ncbi:MAG: DedA family protein [Alphaproteobacteria bacterium]|nr:MAG: DedA family protein [Alphaproteobacteria bacterium]